MFAIYIWKVLPSTQVICCSTPQPVGSCIFFKIAYQPHAIIFYDNTLRLMKNIHGNQSVCCKVFLIFNYLHNSIIGFKNCRIVFFLPFLTEDQKCLSIRMEIILLYGKTQERSLATFQETGH